MPEANCGVERWSVKILTDTAVHSINWTPVQTTVAQENSFPQVSISEDIGRLDFEKQAVTLTATITAFKREDDSDIHLILVDQGDSMIAEIPNTSCQEVDASSFAPQFIQAAAWIATNLGKPSSDFKHVNKQATITGVRFQDFNHSQDGHAKNYREIHPVTKIE